LEERAPEKKKKGKKIGGEWRNKKLFEGAPGWKKKGYERYSGG